MEAMLKNNSFDVDNIEEIFNVISHEPLIVEDDERAPASYQFGMTLVSKLQQSIVPAQMILRMYYEDGSHSDLTFQTHRERMMFATGWQEGRASFASQF